jgi:hypothetical protein
VRNWLRVVFDFGLGLERCPHCGQPGIPASEKAFLGPAGRIVCKRCGRRAGIPRWAILLAIGPGYAAALAVLAYLLASADKPAGPFDVLIILLVLYCLFMAGWAASLVLKVRWAPLVRR